ncbi:MAG: menaquinone biosynthesis protein [Thermoguttaceae bacterium]|nr:menaquinone biosynthesis protein [Thermoguttaceae bacterium]
MFRIGGVSFLNSRPLTLPLKEFFEAHSTGDTIATAVSNRLGIRTTIRYCEAVPSQLAQMLSDGQLDCTLLSSVEALRLSGAKILSDACIASESRVRSVRIFGRVPFAEVRRVALDASSRTSVVLTRILLKRLLPHPVEYTDFPIGADPQSLDADACLSIGDRGMHPLGFPWDSWCLDLAEAWQQLTGLPFVFALWIAHPRIVQTAPTHNPGMDEETGGAEFAVCSAKHPHVSSHVVPSFSEATSAMSSPTQASVDLTQLAQCLSAARDDGTSRLAAIAASEGPRVGVTPGDALDYFQHSLKFRLGVREIAGLTEFAKLLEEDQLVKKCNPPAFIF